MDDMQMQALPGWVTPLATVFLVAAVLSALALAFDLYGRGHRQRVAVLEPVWVLSALWLGPLALPLYARFGRPDSPAWQARHPRTARPAAAAATTGGLAGGAASLVGHLVGVPLVLAAGWTLLGVDMFAMIAVVAVLAVAMLVAFELAVARRSGRRLGTGAALVAALVTVLAFDLGMGGWMLVLHYAELMPPLASVDFVFLMQVGILLGFLTGLPAVAALARREAAHA